ncbi:MAG TPA: HDOD domain-containing protein [Syntrophales bacterium]|nr:HDOD domain-containing protein [Syntrophales bacterium]HQB30426.1 HDOD domain-containing protein [Syntrophales bacterium]
MTSSGTNRFEEASLSRFIRLDLDVPFHRDLFDLIMERNLSRAGIPCADGGEGKQFLRANLKRLDLSEEALPALDLPALLLNDPKIPTLPEVLYKINAILSDPNSSAYEIASAVSLDHALSARLLKIVNSPFYGFSHQIDTVFKAVSIIGTTQLGALVNGVELVRALSKGSTRIHVRSFWKHAIAVGIISRFLATLRRMGDPERYFMAGLLHDIGRLITSTVAPMHFTVAAARAERQQETLRSTEKEIMGMDHGEAGALLLGHWKLPFSLEQMVLFHHAPGRSAFPGDASVVHLSDIIAHSMDVGSSGELFVPPVDGAALGEIDLPREAMALVIGESEIQINEVSSFFFPD